MTNLEKIECIYKQNGGYITRKQIDNESIQSWFLSEFIKKKKLICIARGFYASSNWIIDEYFVFQYTYSKFIFSFSSSLYLHNLVDFLPNFLEVTGPKNYRPFAYNKSNIYIHTDTNNNTYNLGIIKIKTKLNNFVLSYDLEKTVCDLIRNKNKIDIEVYNKALKAYIKRRDKNLDKLISYATTMHIEKKVREIMEILCFEN